MEGTSFEPVQLERLRKDATCIITRLGLGSYELRGPRDNILVPESRVAYTSVIHDLAGEGYELVSMDDYAAATGTDMMEVENRLYRVGSIFAINYTDLLMVAMPQKEALLPDIET